MATKTQIREWLERPSAKSATHVLIVCDTFDWEDYPVYVTGEVAAAEAIWKYNQNMQKVIEVYKMDSDLEKQLEESIAFNL